MGSPSGRRRLCYARYERGEDLPAWQLEGDYCHWGLTPDLCEKEFSGWDDDYNPIKYRLIESPLIKYIMKLSAETTNHLEDLLRQLTHEYKWGYGKAWSFLFTSSLEILTQEASGKSVDQIVLQWPSGIKLGGYLDYRVPKLGTKGFQEEKIFDCTFFLSEEASVAVSALYKSDLEPRLPSWDRKLAYTFTRLTLWLRQQGLHHETRSVYHITKRVVYRYQAPTPVARKVPHTVRFKNNKLFIASILLKILQRENGNKPIEWLKFEEVDPSHGRRPHFLKFKVSSAPSTSSRLWMWPKKVGGKDTDKERVVSLGAIIEHIRMRLGFTPKAKPVPDGTFPVELNPVTKILTIDIKSP